MCFSLQHCCVEAGDSIASLIYGKLSIAPGFIGHVTYVSPYSFLVIYVCLCVNAYYSKTSIERGSSKKCLRIQEMIHCSLY